MNRYSAINDKNSREIVLLRGLGCGWLKCRFCDYHLDSGNDAKANFSLNSKVLANVTGEYSRLEIINSGSYFELDPQTQELIKKICEEKKISNLHVESHWMYRDRVRALRRQMAEQGIELKVKIGVESFDYDYRERYLNKGLDERSPEKIARDFDDCCLLFGLPGQTEKTMRRDLALGLEHFGRVCINIMCENSSIIKPDHEVIRLFRETLWLECRDNPRVDVLLDNLDFGVGNL